MRNISCKTISLRFPGNQASALPGISSSGINSLRHSRVLFSVNFAFIKSYALTSYLVTSNVKNLFKSDDDSKRSNAILKCSFR